MSVAIVVGHAVLIGIVAGLRSMIAPTAVAYARGSWLWMLFGFLAIAELIGDKMPRAPRRTIPPLIVLRCVSGGASAYFLAAPYGASSGMLGGVIAAACGVAGAIIGTYGGYALRVALARRLPAVLAAIAEDILTIALALVAIGGAVSR